MPNDKPYIERRYVELEEVVGKWFATADGPSSTGEYVLTSRASKSAGEALLLLVEALEEQGYALREG